MSFNRKNKSKEFLTITIIVISKEFFFIGAFRCEKYPDIEMVGPIRNRPFIVLFIGHWLKYNEIIEGIKILKKLLKILDKKKFFRYNKDTNICSGG